MTNPVGGVVGPSPVHRTILGPRLGLPMTTAKKTPQDRKPKADEALTIEGIGLSATPGAFRDRLQDWEIAEAMADMRDVESDDGTRLAASVRVMRLLLDDEYTAVKRELRAKHDGKLTEQTMAGFMTSLFEAIAPNS